MVILRDLFPTHSHRSTSFQPNESFFNSFRGDVYRQLVGCKESSSRPCVPWSRLSRFFGDGKPPTFNDGILIIGILKQPYYWVDEFIPLLYGNFMGVDRPVRTCQVAYASIHLTGWLVCFILVGWLEERNPIPNHRLDV